MTDGDALLAAVLAAPDEDTPRLAYADWLDEQGGDGNAARAEFIRVQVELAHLPADAPFPWPPRQVELRAREKRLLVTHAAGWLAPLRQKGEPFQAVGVHGDFRRGFVERVWMPATWFALRAGALFRRAPVRELRVTFVTLRHHLSELLACPFLTRLDALDLSDRALGDDLAAILAPARAVGALRTLRLRGCGLSDAGARRLAGVGFDWRPRELDVSLNPIGEAGLAALRDRFGGDVVRFTPHPPGGV